MCSWRGGGGGVGRLEDILEDSLSSLSSLSSILLSISLGSSLPSPGSGSWSEEAPVWGPAELLSFTEWKLTL